MWRAGHKPGRNERQQMSKWTHFMDMHSGGRTKQPPYENIYIEAPEKEASLIFYNRFGHDPERVSCTCCGDDYSINEHDSLEDATGYERNCEFADEGDGYLERQRAQLMDIRRRCDTPADSKWGLYMTLDEYIKQPDVLVIRASEITAEDREGVIPRSGWVWMD